MFKRINSLSGVSKKFQSSYGVVVNASQLQSNTQRFLWSSSTSRSPAKRAERDVTKNLRKKDTETKEEKAGGVPHRHAGIQRLLDNNRKWRDQITKEDPNFFKQLSKGQQPEYLFLGCSDSRVSAELLTGLGPGELFVHRNIANMVVNTDLSCLSVIQYAVQVLKVKHIVVCGHYDCGGVLTALNRTPVGSIDNWLRNIQDVYRLHQDELDKLEGEAKFRRLVELNTTEQVLNVFKTNFVQDARRENEGFPTVTGLVYDLKEGSLTELDVDVSSYLKKHSHVYTYKSDTDK